jgi:predicted HicB family RNase H-like nuclease
VTSRGRPPIGKPLTIRVDPTLRRKLSDRATREDVSVAELCRRLLEKGVKR